MVRVDHDCSKAVNGPHGEQRSDSGERKKIDFEGCDFDPHYRVRWIKKRCESGIQFYSFYTFLRGRIRPGL